MWYCQKLFCEFIHTKFPVFRNYATQIFNFFLHTNTTELFIEPVLTRILNTKNWGWFTSNRYLFLIFDWRITFQWIFFIFTSKKEKRKKLVDLHFSYEINVLWELF